MTHRWPRSLRQVSEEPFGRTGHRIAAFALAITLVALAGCAPNNIQVAGRVIVEGLKGPTQFSAGPRGTLWIAQLNGGENDRSGQVIVIDPDAPGDVRVVLDGLDKPTGVALFNDELWVLERRRLTRGPLDGSSRRVVVDDLAFNGRSEGSLTVDGDRVLFDTSGRLDGAQVATDSATLWSVDAAGEVRSVATGFKHAYAHTRAPNGTLFTTEIGDGLYDGAAPRDEVVAVAEGRDHGWPRCVGNNRPVAEFDGDARTCTTPQSHALFAPGATPTSIVVAPWDASRLLVALWSVGQVVTVPVAAPRGRPHGATVVFDGAEHPQHLVVIDSAAGTTAQSRLLLSDHTAGTILELNPTP